MGVLRNTYLSSRFFGICAGIILSLCISFAIPILFLPSLYAFAVLLVLTIYDFIAQFTLPKMIDAERKTTSSWSLGDNNHVNVTIYNTSKKHWDIDIIDEIPFQFQIRDFKKSITLEPYKKQVISYDLKPLTRGVYEFGYINLLIKSRINLIARRIQVDALATVKVYPSVIQMKKFELYTMSKIARFHGIKKMRRLGLSYEFEQIKSYVIGDDTRHINWKSTGKQQQLMVNQFEDEKSQPIYNIIDKSRIMMMPFGGMSLMDYSINTCLTISNVALRKQDKAGLITFSDKLGALVKADNRHGQLKAILESLYNQKERELEANYELLYYGIKNLIKTRSLIFLYTNFESQYGLKRVLPVLRKINQLHLLIVVFFENSEVEKLSFERANDLRGVYRNIIAEQAVQDKQAIAQELNALGIQTILTKPEDLSLNTVNKYLEIKSRGLI